MKTLRLSALLTFLGAASALLMSEAANALTINVSPGVSSAAIQADLNSIGAVGGGTLNFAAGTYSITSTESIGSNTTLNGAGSGQTILLGPSSGYTWPILQVNGNNIHNVTIQQMTINGNISSSWANNTSNPYVNQSGILWTCPTYLSSGNFDVNNVEVENCSVGMSGANIDGLTVYYCAVHDCGMWVRANLWQHDLYFNACSYVTINTSNFYNSWEGSGIHLDTTTGNGTNWIVENCGWIADNAELGINVQSGVPNVTISNNYISGNGYGAVYDSNTLAWDGLGYSTAAGGLITGNTSINNKGYGIRVFAGSGSITNNTATGNGLGNYSISGSWTQSNNN